MDLKAVRKSVAKIQSNLFRNSNSFSIGMLKSKFRGSGLQFKDHQIYNHGDDIRFVDWKILAKTNTPYIKTFDEERNVEIAVIIDAGPTMLMGYNSISKLQASIEICCLLYLIAKESGDYVHVVIIADEVINLPKKSGEAGIIMLVSVLERYGILDENGNVNIGRSCNIAADTKEKTVVLMKHLQRQREVVILSDFNEFIEVDLIKKISLKNNVHCFSIETPLDNAKKIPYSIFIKQKDALGKLRNIQRRVFGETNKSIENIVKQRFKKIDVGGRYLEDFVKEMV